MDDNSIFNHINTVSKISVEDFKRFIELSELKYIKKNSKILVQGKDSSKLYFIKSGYLMTYHVTESKLTHVIQFGSDGWWTGDLENIKEGNYSNCTIKAMTDAAILVFSYENFEKLLADSPNFEKYFRILFQNALKSLQKRFLQNISLPAEKRYEELIKKHPKSELYFPQKYVAYFLGITPEFLSKIKSRLYLNTIQQN